MYHFVASGPVRRARDEGELHGRRWNVPLLKFAALRILTLDRCTFHAGKTSSRQHHIRLNSPDGYGALQVRDRRLHFLVMPDSQSV
jgi:hypothetical protein